MLIDLVYKITIKKYNMKAFVSINLRINITKNYN
jgi:hypothetical protein